ncbi:MAG: DUF4234 domain-containing protein [Candidatus Zixiibacteriota bacterium]
MNYEIKKRDMLIQVILMIVTLGIYSIYWFFQTAREMKFYTKSFDVEPALLTILMFVPFANIYSMYKYSELYEKTARDHMSKWIIFILWMVFSPAVWFIVQSELNGLSGLHQSEVVAG